MVVNWCNLSEMQFNNIYQNVKIFLVTSVEEISGETWTNVLTETFWTCVNMKRDTMWTDKFIVYNYLKKRKTR